MATSAELLIEAEGAYHKLMTGQAVAEFQDSNGERVRYTLANASDLLKYINELKRLSVGAAIAPPMRPYF